MSSGNNRSVALLLLILLSAAGVSAQTATELRENARSFMQQGDFSNATLVLNRALQLEPANTEIIRELSLSQFLQKDYGKALETLTPVLNSNDADDQTFQIAGSIYRQLNNPREAEKIYRKALKKFPASGPLYNDYGDLLWAQQDMNAIRQWEKGIETDPSFSKNYFNACKYYALRSDWVWALLYGEIFVNIEPIGSRTPEIKALLLEGYKKIFLGANPGSTGTESKPFETAFRSTLDKEAPLSSRGINAETLTMIRTRFILDWDSQHARQFPFRLFDLHRQLLREGLFDAYNQWLFGSSENLAAFQQWTTTHDAEYKAFTKMQRSRIFKLPAGQYYH
jgi:Tfp pilus assembly protein PilF